MAKRIIKPVFQIGVNCAPDVEERIKKFCRLSDQTVAKFAGVAMSNEVDAQLAEMSADKRKVIETLLRG